MLEEQKMEITRTTLTVMVDDFDRSVGFYTQHLGFVVEYSAAPHFAMLNRAGLRLGVHPRGTNPSAGGCDGLSVGFEVPDVDLAVSELQRQGVVFPSGSDEKVR